MNTTKQFRLMAMIIAVSLISAVNVDAQFEESAKWVPESANALVLVNAEKILQSEIAIKERWKSDRSKRFQSGATFLPPTTKRLLLAAQLDYEYMEAIQQVAVFEKSGAKIDILPLSKQVGGNIEKIGDYDAVLLPNDAYLVKIDGDTLVSMTPANRQVTSRWLRSRNVATMSLSPYLTEAANFAAQNADVIVAFDLTDVIHPETVKSRVEESGLCSEDQVGDVCKDLASIRGLTLGITINDKITGAIKIDFTGSPAVIGGGEMGKEILIRVLEKNGIMIEDFRKWDVQVTGNQIRLGGPISRMGLRQISTLIEHPLAADFNTESGGGQNTVDMKTRSMQYFGAVQKLTEELRHKDFKAMTTYAKFFDKYARQIDNMSVLNVDPVVLSYGTYVADSFRSVSGGLLDVNLQKVRDRQTYAPGSANYHGRGSYSNWNGYTSRYGWGWSSNNQDTRNRQRVSGEARLKGEILGKEIMSDVAAHGAEVRAQMSEKYQADF